MVELIASFESHYVDRIRNAQSIAELEAIRVEVFGRKNGIAKQIESLIFG